MNDRKPELRSEVMAFRDYLLSSTVSDTLDVWELKDLGHQTAQRIVHASDPLQSMQEINQNFPSVVSSLSRMKELSLANQFSKLKIPDGAIRKLLLTTPLPEPDSYRVDFRSEHVNYLNNLEEDDMYKRWRSNLNEVISTAGIIEDTYDILLPKVKSPPQEILLKLQQEHTLKEASEASSMFVFKLGLAKLKCSFLMNGLVFDSVEEETLLNAMNDELPKIQEQVYYGQIESRTNVLDKLLSESGLSRYNPQIIGGGKNKPRYVSLASSTKSGESMLDDVNYLHSSESSDDVKYVTHLLAVDVTTKKGMKLLHEGVRYLIGGSKSARLGVLFSSSPNVDPYSLLFIKFFEITASSFSHKEKALHFLDKLCSFYEREYLFKTSVESGSSQMPIDKVLELAEEYGLSSKAYQSRLVESLDEELRKRMIKVAQFLSWELGLESDANTIISNGRVIFPVDERTFMGHDLHLLESMEFNQRVKPVQEIIEGIEWQGVDPDLLTSKYFSDVFMLVSSAMATRDRSSESARFEVLSSEYSAVLLGDENATIHIDAVIDPLSPTGQKLASLLQVLQKHVQTSMRIVLNPMINIYMIYSCLTDVSSLVDIPLKNYYRYVLPNTDDYSSTNFDVDGPKAFFANMPLSKTLTMNLDVPEPWLVEPVIAIHDLDNILLENLGDTTTLQAVFEVESLVLTGHCSEKDHEAPRGLQLILGTKNRPHLVDTLVMANLGYWQMKVSPGVWYLQLAPGRSSELYVLKGGNDGSQDQSSLKRITIDDLRGKVVHLEVVKKRGKEHEKLLVPTDGDDGVQQNNERGSWNSNFLKWASGFVGGRQQSVKEVAKKLRSLSIAVSSHLLFCFVDVLLPYASSSSSELPRVQKMAQRLGGGVKRVKISSPTLDLPLVFRRDGLRFHRRNCSSSNRKPRLRIVSQKWKLNDIDTNAVQERFSKWVSKSQKYLSEVATPLIKKKRQSLKVDLEDEHDFEDLEELLTVEQTVQSDTLKGSLSFDAIISIEQFSRMNGLTGKKMQDIFETLVPPATSINARYLVEYCCFRFLSRDSSEFHPCLKRERLQKPSEQERLLRETPRIIEDLIEIKRESAASSESSKQGNMSGMSQEAAIEID
ncbi:hypothetical protein F2Q69_00051379 [Brassica cretica]|uniref:Uncharacterized protein n=1 Tax=Brassica cretica TaxID=69181 RepID=A0A8S9PNN3_BRACR|nr:hypothetical protein F2Q69_00051379 [Brassica cretica]